MKRNANLLKTAICAAIAVAVPASMAANYFSLDIGSDQEVSDPFGGIGEFADPGDLYQSSQVAGSLLGVAPSIDDVNLFGGVDPFPVQNFAATAAPIGTAGMYTNFFDMDGFDALGDRLSQLGLNPQQPLDTPLYRNTTQVGCVNDGRELVISYSDDSVDGWGAALPPRVPTEGTSPLGFLYGTTAGQNEIIALSIDPSFGFPAVVLSVTSVGDEVTVHTDLGPNPTALTVGDDDDIDALDIHAEGECQVSYFSADSEGRMGLNAGMIYEFSGAGAPVPVISPIHLGLPNGVNIDAFEFAWLPTPNGQGAALALLYSVQADDLASVTIDESGGQLPSTIFGSFLTGVSFVVVPGPANGFDNVDAIAVRLQQEEDSDGDGVGDNLDNCTLEPNPNQVDADGDGIGNQCDTDSSGDCLTNFIDLAEFRLAFFGTDPVFDYNIDGAVNFLDLVILKDYFFSVPGPAAEPNLCSP